MDKSQLTQQIIQQLNAHILVFENLLSNIPSELLTWKVNKDNWSLLEVVCHLVDEERLDFRARIEQLQDPNLVAFKPIDPLTWVKDHDYQNQSLTEQIETFKIERANSIDWISNLDLDALNYAIEHQHFGKMSGHMLLQNWLVHDYIHIRQILKIKHAYLKSISQENLDYAGNW